MERIKNEVFALIVSINMILTNYFGKMTLLLYIVIGLMGLDLVTRIYAAGMNKNEKVESKKIMKGLYKKLGLCLLILLSVIMDVGLCFVTKALALPSTDHIIFTNLTLGWLFIRELISNLENLQSAGIELPRFIMKALCQTKQQVEALDQQKMMDDYHNNNQK